jgi:hypothetical protein
LDAELLNSANSQSTTAASPVRLLRGSWDSQTKAIDIVETAVTSTADAVHYMGALSVAASGDVVVQLQSVDDDASQPRSVRLRLEAEDCALHHSGAWLGVAEPAPELVEFGLPSNPTQWSMCVLKRGPGIVFGGGYFDDSGDVPGKPVLYFTLYGTCRLLPDRAAELAFEKRYEASSETQGVLVQYCARLLPAHTAAIVGTWRNASSGGYGAFRCTSEPMGTVTAHLVRVGVQTVLMLQ